MIKIVRNIFIVCGLLFFLCACGAKTVNLTYDANGGTLPEGCEKIQQVSKENPISLPNPTKQGYEFLGWYDGNNVNDKQYFSGDMFKEDRTLYARWKLEIYTVTFIDIDNKIISIQNVEYGKNATAPENPEILGHTFKGWDKDFTNVTSDLILTAMYDVNTYEVTFKDHEGDIIKTETVEYGKDATAPQLEERIGYTFTGWDVTFTNVTKEVEVKPLYQVNTYQVTFKDFNGLIFSTQTVIYGNDALAPADPEREGSTFKGWDKDFTNVTSDLILTAMYDVNTYEVTFKDHEGDIIKTETVEYGKDATAPQLEERIGYTFTGWDVTFTNVTKEVEVKPLYQVNTYQVTFKDFNGLIFSTQTVIYGNDALAPADPEREGSTFKGWDKDFTNVTSDLILTAMYDVNTYEVTFKDHEGDIIKTETVEYGKDATAPQLEERIGYTFTGWDVTFTNVTKEVEVKPLYQVNTYQVTFKDFNGLIFSTQTVIYGNDALAPADPEREGSTFKGWDKDFTNVTSDLILTAMYDVNTYEVTFKDHEGDIIKTETVEYGKDATAPQLEERIGYTFTGWDVTFTNVTKEVEVKPLYQVNTYQVTFKDFNGLIFSTQTVIYGNDALAPADPEREGSTFKGWDKDFTNVTSDLILTAMYDVNTYEVTFKDHEGDIIKTETVEYGKDATAPQLEERIGYTFTGWDVTFTNVTKEVEVKPLYQVNTYQVTFKDFNGLIFSIQNVEYGKNATAPENPEILGHTFKGWDKDFTNVTSDLILTAMYDVNTYEVTFKDHEGDIIKTETVEYGKDATAPQLEERIGYTFTGWDVTFTNVTKEVEVKPLYQVNTYQVTFKDFNGLIFSTQTVIYGNDALAPADPEREGSTFKGWDKDFTNVTSDLILTAMYDVNTYEVTFKDHEGDIIKTETVEYGKDATAPQLEERIGYTFTGWDVTFTNVTKELEVKPLYQVNTYQVTFKDFNGLIFSTQTVIYGNDALAPADPEREGSTFKGWDKDFTNVTSDLILTAMYDVNTYEVTFKDHEGDIIKTETVEYGKDATAPQLEERIGYTFTGWDVTFTNVTKEVEVKPLYQVNTYQVTFKDFNGLIFSIQNVEYGNDALAPADPEREGSTFKGWDKDFTNVTSDLILTAMYDVNTYTITFDSNGGTLIDSQKVIKGEKATEPTIPIKEGYTFVGWFMGEEKWSFIGYSVTEDITLVAKWIEDIDFNIEGATLESNVYHLSVDNNVTSINFKQIVQSNQIWYLSKDINGTSINITKVGLLEIGNNTFYIIEEDGNDYNTYEINIRRLPMYTVTFITNSDAILESIEIQEGSLIGTIPTITKEGYAFDKWDYDFTIPVTSNITLSASWIFIIEYSITYHLDGGVNSVNNPDKYSNISDTIILEDATKTGFTFLGWYSEETFISKVTKIEQGSTNDITLYARFAAETYTLHFVTNGGSEVSDITEEYGKEISVSTIKEGYSFFGWYKDSSLSLASYYELGSTMPAENLTLYAKWQLITYSITYVMNEYTTNDASNPATYNVTSNISLIAPSVIEGTFIGWFTDEDYTNEIENISNMTGNITLYAKVEMNQYTMTFVTNGGTEISPITQDYGTAIHVSTTKEGYMFEAWCSDEGLTTSIDISKMPNANLTVYAKWAQMYEYFTIDNMTYVYYGTYPQTVVDDSSLISSLNSLTSTNANGYYEFEGEEYAKVVAHPYETGYKFINGSTIQSGQTYYFKVEPIKWRVLEEADGTYTLLSEYIIDKQVFYTSNNIRTIGDQTIYANNYEHSTIREWLNSAFYNKAFSTPEKGSILTTLVDNSASTTNSSTNPYFSNNTMDKVYLLSYQEATSSTYGFSEHSTRTAVTTDYARAVGAYMNTSTSYYGNGYWWLRSPDFDYPYYAHHVDSDGKIYYYSPVLNSYSGARPAIKIG